MAENSFVEVALTTNLDNERFVPIVDTSEIYMPNKNLRALTAYNIAKKAGEVKIGDQKIKVLNQRRFEDRVTLASDCTSTSLVVNSTTMLRALYRLYDINTNQEIEITSVTNGTTCVVTTVTATVTAGSVLAIMGRTVAENWTISTPISRASAHHWDYSELKQESYAFSWHLKYREAYVESVSVSIPKQFNDEFDIKMNTTALMGVGREGTSTTVAAQMQGLIPQGIAYNLIECPGAITPDLFNKGVQILANEGNARNGLEVIMAPTLLNLWALWPFGAGILRLMGLTNSEWGLGPLSNIKTPVEGISGIKPTSDQCLEKPGFNNILILVNWDAIKGIGFGDDYLQPNVQPLGSGYYMTQLTRSIGFEYKIPAGAVVVYTNVNSFVA